MSEDVDAWKKWFEDSGAAEYWSKVECIECHLMEKRYGEGSLCSAHELAAKTKGETT